MKKKVLSIFLAALMLVSLLPVTALADGEATFDPCSGAETTLSAMTPASNPTWGSYVFAGWYDAEVGGNALGEGTPAAGTTYYAHWWTNASKNVLVLTEPLTVKENGLFVGAADKETVLASPSAYGLAFTAADNPDPAKLTMTGAVIDTANGAECGDINARDYAALLSTVGTLTIELNGENSVRLGKAEAHRGYGICAGTSAGKTKYDLTVTGTGSLSAAAGEGQSSYGVCCKNLTLTSGTTLTASSGKATGTGNYGLSYGVYCEDGALSNYGTLTATGGEAVNESGGVYSYTPINYETGTLTVTAGSATGSAGSYGKPYSCGAYFIGAFLNYGTITARGGAAANGTSCGVMLYNGINNTGTITATAGNGKEAYGVYIFNPTDQTSEAKTISADGVIYSYGAAKLKTLAEGTGIGGAGTPTDYVYPQAVPDKPIIITGKYFFDKCDGSGMQTPKSVPADPAWSDYVFAGWYDAKIGGNKVTSPEVGTAHYAHWWTDSTKKTLVLTDHIEVKENGVYIGGSATKATDTELKKYGIKFTAPAGDAPAILELDGAAIAPTLEQPSRNTKNNCFYSAIYSETCPLKINVKSESSVLVNSFVPKSDKTNVVAGIYANQHPLTISGEKLNVSADGCNKAMYVYGIYVSGESVYIDGKVFTEVKNTCSGDNANAIAIIVSKQLYFHGKAEVTAVATRTMDGATTSYADAISAQSDGIIIGGDAVVNAYGGIGTVEYYGLWSSGNILVCDNAVLNAYGGTKSGSDPVVKEALFLENAEKTITVKDNGKIVADSAVKNLGKYGDTNEGFYTVTGAQTDIATGKGLVLTKIGDANIEISAKTYTVTFKANGGTVSPTRVTTQAYIQNSPTVTRSGYTFAGWYKDAAFTQMWDMEHDYARKGLTLYAKWVKDSTVGTVSGTVKNDATPTPAPVSGAAVNLMKGDAVYDNTSSTTDGTFSFSNVPAGEYQLVVTKDDYTTTALVTVTSDGTVTGGGTITLYTTSKTSSAVEIEGSDTPDIMVGGLAEVALAYKSGSDTVSVTLEVEKLAENAVDPDDKAKIEAAADNAQTLDYIDMTLVFKINNIRQDDIADTGAGKLLEVVIPYNLSGRNNIAFYRQHGDDTSAVKLPEGADNAVNGEYVIIDKANNLIRAHLRYFSTYAIGYEEEQSYGGGASSYAIELPANVKNGKIEVSPKSASAGQTVTLNVTPDKGFTLETLTVLDKNGKEIEVKNLGNNKYSFTMPSGKVSISATFMEDNSMLNFFVDVKATDYFYDAVLWAAENGITKGTDDVHFSPDMGTTRAQVVTFLWRAAGCPVVNYYMNMSDVKSGEYYTEAVRWALSEGITKGTSATTFSPDMVCTRGQIVTFLARFAGVEDADTASAFTDVKTTDYFAAAVKWAKDNGVTEGTSATTFSPNDDCTRAQVVTFLYRWMVR